MAMLIAQLGVDSVHADLVAHGVMIPAVRRIPSPHRDISEWKTKQQTAYLCVSIIQLLTFIIIGTVQVWVKPSASRNLNLATRIQGDSQPT
jgi:hypothetical protein